MRDLSVVFFLMKLNERWVVFQFLTMKCKSLLLTIDQCFSLLQGYLRSWLSEIAAKAEAVGLKFGERQRIVGYMHCAYRYY